MNNNTVDRIILSAGVEVFGTTKYNIDDVSFNTRNRIFIPENAESILCCLFPYYSKQLEHQRNISYYACVDDYHNVAGDILENICGKLGQLYNRYKFVHFVDNSPINEVKVAAKCGLGVVGENSLLINDIYGSFVFIGCIVTDMDLGCYNKKESIQSCIGCGKCGAKCPAGAILSDGVDKNKCLSHITQKKGELTAQESDLIKQIGIVWGCDICQQVCPMNDLKKETHLESFKTNIQTRVDSENVDKLIKTRAFGYRGIKVMRRNLDICGY